MATTHGAENLTAADIALILSFLPAPCHPSFRLGKSGEYLVSCSGKQSVLSACIPSVFYPEHTKLRGRKHLAIQVLDTYVQRLQGVLEAARKEVASSACDVVELLGGEARMTVFPPVSGQRSTFLVDMRRAKESFALDGLLRDGILFYDLHVFDTIPSKTAPPQRQRRRLTLERNSGASLENGTQWVEWTGSTVSEEAPEGDYDTSYSADLSCRLGMHFQIGGCLITEKREIAVYQLLWVERILRDFFSNLEGMVFVMTVAGSGENGHSGSTQDIPQEESASAASKEVVFRNVTPTPTLCKVDRRCMEALRLSTVM
jgi:hypothetical protein